MIKNMMVVLYYPADGYQRLHQKKPYWQAILLYLCVCIIKVCSVEFMHRPLATVYPEDTNLFFEVLKMIVPLLSFVLVSYGMSTLNNGEARMGDMFIGTAFCMTPYILAQPILILLSRILSASDAGIFGGLTALLWVWIFYQFYRQINELNNYTFPQTIGLIVLTVCGILAVWVLLALLYFLSRNLISFFLSVAMELYMIFS